MTTSTSATTTMNTNKTTMATRAKANITTGGTTNALMAATMPPRLQTIWMPWLDNERDHDDDDYDRERGHDDDGD